jgi:hypothetical protein
MNWISMLPASVNLWSIGEDGDKNRQTEDGGVTQGVEGLPSKCEALSSNPCAAKRNHMRHIYKMTNSHAGDEVWGEGIEEEENRCGGG